MSRWCGACVAWACISQSSSQFTGDVDIDVAGLERAAQAAYDYQVNQKAKLRPELAELLGHPRWPCFWGEEYSSDLSEGRGDGGYGYRTCGLRHIAARSRGEGNDGVQQQQPCVVYSFGSDGDFEFERAVAKLTGLACEIHIFDLHEDRGLSEAFDDIPMISVHYHQVGIMDKDGMELVKMWSHSFPQPARVHTLSSIMKQLGHEHVDVLKIDIEGNEHRVIAQLAEEGWPAVPGQVYMEVHAAPIFGDYDASHVKRAIQSLEKVGLRLFHIERPWAWCSSSCLQLSFIHQNWRPQQLSFPEEPGWLHEEYDILLDVNLVNFVFQSNGTGTIERPLPYKIPVHIGVEPIPRVAPQASFVVLWYGENVGRATMLKGCCRFVSRKDKGWNIKHQIIGPADKFWSREIIDAGLAKAEDDVPVNGSFVAYLEFQAPLGPPGLHVIPWQLATRAGHGFGPIAKLVVFLTT